jgi:outer membrane protein assembly factor BamB
MSPVHLRTRTAAVLSTALLAMPLGVTGAAASGKSSAAAAADDCGRRSFAAAIAPSGRLLWRTAMPATPDDFQASYRPAVGGSASYWPEDGFVHALRNSDGHQLWQYDYQDYELVGIWVTRGVVSVLLNRYSKGDVLVGLDAHSGVVRWRLTIPGGGLTFDAPAPTGDGGLAWLRRDGRLQVADLVTGKLRWSHTVSGKQTLHSPDNAFAAGEGRVYFAVSGLLTTYDARTGEHVWQVARDTTRVQLRLAGTRVLLTSHTTDRPTSLAGFDVADGTKVWAYRWSSQQDVLAVGADTVVVGTTLGPDEWAFAVSTGVQRWMVSDPLGYTGPMTIVGSDVVSIDGAESWSDTAALIDRDLATGTLRWSRPVTHDAAMAGALAVMGSSVMLVPDGESAGPNEPLYGFRLADGKAAWTVRSLRPLQDDPVVTSHAVYVSAADQTETCPF